MTIKHAVLHSIGSSDSGKSIELNLRDDELTTEGASVSLFTQLKQTFQRSATRQYGLFDPEQSDNPLPALIAKYKNEELGFLSTTTKLMQHLKLSLANFDESFSSHLLFVVEELMEQKYNILST